MFVMLHIPEALRHTVMPWTPTWVNQEKINNISLKFCLKMFIMLHIPEALRHTVMLWTPTWVNEKRYSNARVNSIMLFLLQSVQQGFLFTCLFSYERVHRCLVYLFR